jgi:hypothetical protein
MNPTYLDFVNVFLALKKTAEENFKNNLLNVDQTISQIRAIGESDNSEATVQMRELCGKVARDLQGMIVKASNRYQKEALRMIENVDKVYESLSPSLPEEFQNRIHNSISNLKQLVEKGTNAREAF